MPGTVMFSRRMLMGYLILKLAGLALFFIPTAG